jgi:polyhydroxybutyrate depolymerase
MWTAAPRAPAQIALVLSLRWYVGLSAPANLRTASHLLRGLLLLAIWFSAGVLALAQPTSTVQFSAASYTVAESAGAVTLTVQRVNDTNTPVSVDYATADGTATNGLKYTAVSGTLAFGTGETNQTLVVPIVNNGFVEGSKNFRVILSNPTNAVLGTRTNVTVYITDSDVGVQFQLSATSVAEDAGAVLIGVVRGDDAPLPVTVDVATSDLTATSGLDYVGLTNTLAFEPTERLKFFSVPILNHSLRQPNKSFRLTLSHPTNATLGGTTTTTVTILDQDPGFQFASASYAVAEDAGAALISVVRGSDENFPGTVDYATADGTATNGLDYTATQGILTFAPGEKVKLIPVPILNDGVKEASKTFRISLSNPTGGSLLGARTNTTASIQDNDPGLGFELPSYSVCEQATAGEITLTIVRGNDGALGPITADFATGDLSARAGTDYQAVSGTLEFQANETVKSLTVPILRPPRTGATKNFRVTLTNPTGGATLGIATTVVSILENYPTLTPPADARLAIRREGGVNVLTWTGDGQLQRADRVTGPWQTLTAARSPWPVQSPVAMTFYRVKGTRLVSLYIPSAYDGQTPLPLVILLHGYTATGNWQESYMQFRPLAEARRFFYCYPDGTIDRWGNHFWNATDAGCDFGNTGVNDAGYLRQLIEETARCFAVDRRRVFLIGHSNGGRMSYRLACESADIIAGLASLAGMPFLEPSQCEPSEPVNILHLHGTADDIDPYGGGALTTQNPLFPANMPASPGAVKAVQNWAGYNGASDPVTDVAPSLDLSTDVAGLDTVVTRYTNYPPGGAVELWTINGGGHIPTLSSQFSPRVIDWLLAHPKP